MWSHYFKVGIGVEISTSSKGQYRIPSPRKLEVDGSAYSGLSLREAGEELSKTSSR
jgi:hypothetical protein